LGFWTGRVLLGLAIALVALAASGAIYQAVASAIDQRSYPPPGQLVDVGGYKLHLNVQGQTMGQPTVILEAGMASFSSKRSLGVLPLTVLSVTEQALYAETLTQLQAALPVLSSNSIHLTVQGATHENLIARRENALIVVDAIRRVIESAQTGEPLGHGNQPTD
jgi:hypothetical protein